MNDSYVNIIHKSREVYFYDKNCFTVSVIYCSVVELCCKQRQNERSERNNHQSCANGIGVYLRFGKPGNKLAFEYYLDLNGDGEIGPQEESVEFYYITDGIGWIKDPDDSENDFAGDETNVDGNGHDNICISVVPGSFR